MTKRALTIVVAVLVLIIVIGCILVSILGVKFLPIYFAASNPANCTPVEQNPVFVAPSVCDPSTVPFTDMGELDPTVVTKINGPAIYEWWNGGALEGVQRVDAGSSISIHGLKGHYWTLPSQVGLDCAWSLHVSNYAAKPQHAGKSYDQLVIPPPAEYLK